MKECIGVVAGSSGETITDELLRRGYDVALVAGAKGEKGLDKATYPFVCDLGQCEEIRLFLSGCNVRKVIMGTGHILAVNLMSCLENNGFVTSVNPHAAAIAQHKAKYKQALRDIGLPTADFLCFDQSNRPTLMEIAEKIGIPCVVKSPANMMGTAKENVKKANNHEELALAIDAVIAVDSVLVEKYIYGMDYTVAVTNDGKKATAWTIAYYSKAKDMKLSGFADNFVGTMTPEMESQAKLIAERAAWEIGNLGLPRIDMMTTADGEIYILECNPVSVTGRGTTQHADFEKGVLDAVDESYVDLLIDTAMVVFDSKLQR